MSYSFNRNQERNLALRYLRSKQTHRHRSNQLFVETTVDADDEILIQLTVWDLTKHSKNPSVLDVEKKTHAALLAVEREQ